MPDACPCGRPLAYTACCGRYLDHDSPAPDAESLMRSRYSAFVRGRRDYLLATWHVSMRPPQLELDGAVKWLGLEVHSHRVLDVDHAEVEFVARCKESGRVIRLHECSRFVRESGRWCYVDGDQF